MFRREGGIIGEIDGIADENRLARLRSALDEVIAASAVSAPWAHEDLNTAYKVRSARFDEIIAGVRRARAVAQELRDRERRIAALLLRAHEAERQLEALVTRPGYAAIDRVARRLAGSGPAPVTAEEMTSAAVPAPEGQDSLPVHVLPATVALVELVDWVDEARVVLRDDPELCQQLQHTRSDLRELLLALTEHPSRHERAGRLAVREARLRQAAERLEAELTATAQRRASRALDAVARFWPRPAPRRRSPTGAAGHASVVRERDETAPPAAWPEAPAAWTHQVIGMLDAPASHCVVLDNEPLQLAGWALAAAVPVTRVDVVIDGQVVGGARLGYVRTDVRDRYPQAGAHAVLCGFDFLCPPDLLAGREVVTVELVAHTGFRGGAQSAHPLGTRVIHVGRSTAATSSQIPAARVGHPRRVAGERRAAGLNLLVFTHDLGYGGAQLWLSELLDRCGAGRDFPCTVASPSDGPLAAELRRLGIRVHVSGWVPADDRAAHDGRIAEAAGWAADEQFTAVLANTMLAYAGAVVAHRCRLPLVWAVHESWRPSTFWSVAYPKGFLDRGVRQEAEQALARAGAVVFEAEATRALYADAVGPDAAQVVPYGIGTAAVRDYCSRVSRGEARRLLGLDDAARVLLVMGTVEPRKWQAGLAVAFQQVAAQHPDAELVLVGGSDSPYADGIVQFARAAGLASRIRVVPVVADAYPWYRAADVLICGSDVESLPRSVLEAMAFALPVAATSVFGLPELLTDGETGVLFAAGDISAAAEALRAVLDRRPAELQAIGEAGRRLAFTRHDSSGYASTIRRLLTTAAMQGADDEA